jgi:hypothetical protein
MATIGFGARWARTVRPRGLAVPVALAAQVSAATISRTDAGATR